MPEVKIEIGGREFDVACQTGEEHFLRTAAGYLDVEAQVLVGQIGRIPAERMLLMAGLMLADKMAGLEDKLRAAKSAAPSQGSAATAVPDPAAPAALSPLRGIPWHAARLPALS